MWLPAICPYINTAGRRHGSTRLKTRPAMCLCSDDGRLYTFSKICPSSSWNCNNLNLAADQLLQSRGVLSAVRAAYRPSITVYKSHLLSVHPPPAGQDAVLGSMPCWASSLPPLASDCNVYLPPLLLPALLDI